MSLKNVLITGNYRSGTEYLSHLLNGLSRVTSEMYATNFLRNYHNANSVLHFKHQIISHLETRKNVIIPDDVLNILQHNSDIPKFMRFLYSHLSPQSEIFIDKEQLAWKYFKFFKSIFPYGKIIIVVRDPRAIMNSFRKFTVHVGDYYLTSCLNSLGLYQFIESNANSQDILVIRYEDLMMYQDRVIEQICVFLKLSSHEFSCGNIRSTLSGQMWNGNTTLKGSFNFEASNNCWKSELNPFEIQLVDMVCGRYYSCYQYDHWSEKNSVELNTNSLSQWVGMQFENYFETGSGICKFPSE